MYLHFGQDYIVPLQSVVAVFDMDTATASKRTRLLLERLQDEGRIIELYDDLPRAAALKRATPCRLRLRRQIHFSTKRICRVYADISQATKSSARWLKLFSALV